MNLEETINRTLQQLLDDDFIEFRGSDLLIKFSKFDNVNLRKQRQESTKEDKLKSVYTLLYNINIYLNNNINLNRKENIENKEKEKERESKEIKENFDDPFTIYIERSELLEKMHELYKKFGYGQKWHKMATEKKLLNILNNKMRKWRLNPNQIIYACAGYLTDMSERGTECQYVKGSEVLLSNAIFDYAERTNEQYESAMLKKYGENWKDYKFKVVERKGE